MDEAAQLRFSTEALPERERIAAFRELYGRKMLRLEMEPQPDGPFHADLTLQLLPGLGIVSADSSLLRVGRTRQLLADSDDNLILQISTSAGVASQLCREIDVPSGRCGAALRRRHRPFHLHVGAADPRRQPAPRDA